MHLGEDKFKSFHGFCNTGLESCKTKFLNSSGKTIDIGGDPCLSSNFGPAAILRVNVVFTTLLHRHESRVGDVPGQGGHGPRLRVHHGVLNDVGLAGHVLGEVALHPARRAARFGQQTSGNQTVAGSNLPEDDVLRQNMITVRVGISLPECNTYLVPGTL